MNNERTADSATFVLCLLAAAIMIGVSGAILPPDIPSGQRGLCLPSPNLWLHLPYENFINGGMIFLCVFGAMLLNKKYGLIRSADPSLPSLMVVLIASNPLMTGYLGTPVLMLAANMVCLGILMGAYRLPNATHQMFAVATFLALGTMIQYAFIPYVLVYPILAIMIKAMRLKEILAYIMGLVAPYWIGLAFGLITFSDFSTPQFQFSLPEPASGETFFLMLLSLATAALLALITSLNNVMILFAGNSRIRIYNNMVNAIGLISCLCMIFDFNNIAAYASTFCFTASVQIANFFAIHRIPRSRLWFYSVISIFIVYFILIVSI